MAQHHVLPTPQQLDRMKRERGLRIRNMQRSLFISAFATVIIIILIGIFGGKTGLHL